MPVAALETRDAHDADLLSTIAIALPAAFLGGYLARLVRAPAILGYLLAGVAIGPFTPGLVANSEVALEVAEIGVVLLMFGVGLHFSVADLLAVRRLALPGALGQIVVSAALGVAVAVASGWSIAAAAMLGLAISVASTVVLLRAVEQRGMLDSDAGRVAVGWLIVEDVFTAVVIVVIPTFSAATLGRVSRSPATSAWRC